jgi:hypothetical protein
MRHVPKLKPVARTAASDGPRYCPRYIAMCNARYHRGGPVYWSADMPKCLNMYNTSYLHTVPFKIASSARWGVV